MNYNRNALAVLLFVTLFSAVAFAQSFTLTPRGSTTRSTTRLNEATSFWMDIRNNTNDTLHLNYHYIRDNVPEAWIVSMCVGNACYPEIFNSVDYDIPPMTLDSTALDIYNTSLGENATASIRVMRIGTNDSIRIQCQLVTVSAPEGITPSGFTLSEVYPNPFNNSSTLRLSLPRDASIGWAIHDVTGRSIVQRNQLMGAGDHSISLAENFSQVNSGTYFLTVTTPFGHRTHRLVYIR